MNRRLLQVQTAILAAGTVFSWTTLVLDYRRYFAADGQVFQLSGCAVSNPLVTPCFYGAIAFVAAFAWAVAILRGRAERAPARQRGLHWLLAAGTLFAWGNFAYEVYQYLQPQSPPSAFSCPPLGAANPLTAPCFYGAIIYLSALLLSRRLLARRGPTTPNRAAGAGRQGVRTG
ncbi:MAG TPA: hypothetical protein VFR50_14165 [Casimicrobiaceae bacterium]|jgi:hypothetical protein|nr:hypothetical protein [Casimicrobiaceae bacterium]